MTAPSGPILPSTELSFLAPWIDGAGLAPAVGRVIRRALGDVGVLEAPPGSNRGRRIDFYNNLCGVPLGSPYCASSLTAWCKWAGIRTPPIGARWWRDAGLSPMNPAAVDAWVTWSRHEGLWTTQPALGHAVIYGDDRDEGQHIGLIVRAPGERQPFFRSFEANTSTNPGYSRDGDGFEFKWLRDSQLARVRGYVRLVSEK